MTEYSDNKDGGIIMSVIAGLAVGIALVMILSFLFGSVNNATDTRSVFDFENAQSVKLRTNIYGVPNTVEIGTVLQPTVRIAGTVTGCAPPPYAEVRDITNNVTVWNSGLTTVFCDPDAEPRSVTIEWVLGREYVENGVSHPRSNNVMIAEKTGTYELTVEYAGLKEIRVFDAINSQNNHQEKLVSITKELPIVKEFMQRYKGMAIVTSMHTESELLSKFQKYNPQSLVYYSIRHELAEDVHKELQLAVVIDNNGKPVLSFMQCLGPVSVEIPLISPNLWSMADDCVTK